MGLEFDPRLLQSVRLDTKLWPHLHMTLAVGGMFNTNSLKTMVSLGGKG